MSFTNVGIQPRTTATSLDSHESEKNHNQWIFETIQEMNSDLKIEKKVTIETLINKKPEYAIGKNNQSLSWHSDGGFFYHQNKKGKWNLIGVAENKWQKNKTNACERVFRYLSYLKGNQLFVSCSGPGFKEIGGTTSVVIEMLKYSGAYVIENVNTEEEFKQHFTFWIENLINEAN